MGGQARSRVRLERVSLPLPFPLLLPTTPDLSMMIHYCKWESLLNILEDTLLYLHL
jgi:hypothetical protein